MVLQERIELSTSPLPRECSTTELPQHRGRGFRPNRSGGARGDLQKIALCHPPPIRRAQPCRRWTQAGKGANRVSMTKSPRNPQGGPREARLKAALRANLARRKAQGRARAAEESQDEQQGQQTPDQGAPRNED